MKKKPSPVELEIQALINESISFTNIYDLLMNANHSGFMHERLKNAQEFIRKKHALLKKQVDTHPDQELLAKLTHGKTISEGN